MGAYDQPGPLQIGHTLRPAGRTLSVVVRALAGAARCENGEIKRGPAPLQSRIRCRAARRLSCRSTGSPAMSEPSAVLRVAIASDNFLTREGLGCLLSGARSIEIVARVDSHPETLTAIRQYRPDVLIVGIRTPRVDAEAALSAARQLRSQYPSIAVVVIAEAGDGYALELLRSGAAGVGYLLDDRIGDLEDSAERCPWRSRGRHRSRPLDRECPGTTTAAFGARRAVSAGTQCSRRDGIRLLQR